MAGESTNNPLKIPVGRRTLQLTFIVCVYIAPAVFAASTVFPFAPEPVGSGARALGQSAFIAVADDATAAAWNPAGLINLEKPEMSFVGAWKASTNDLSSLEQDYQYGKDSWSLGEINFMSYALPMKGINQDMVLSINYHQVYDLGVKWGREWHETGVPPPRRYERTRYRSVGAISAYSLAVGLSNPIYPEITIGASFNWYTPSLLNDHVWRGKSTEFTEFEPGDTRLKTTTETFDDLNAHNFTLGLLWNVYEKQEKLLTLGLVCHTPFTAEMEYKSVEYKTYSLSPSELDVDVDSLDVDFPLSLGAGANYRFCDEFSMAFDIHWTDWSEFTYTDDPWPLTDDAIAYRLGGEYLFLEGARESLLACRGGVFYEPRPAWDEIVPVYGLSAGLGWTVMERFSLDFAYQYRWGKEDLENFDYQIEEQFFVASLITYFGQG